MNSLNLIFGPSMPKELDSVGLSFLSSPTLQPDYAVASFTEYRYVPANTTNVVSLDIFSDYLGLDKNLDINVAIPSITLQNSYTGATNYTGTQKVGDDPVELKVLNSEIKVTGMHISAAGTWHPSIRPGVIWKKHIISSSEPASSWLIRSGLVPGDEVILIYSVPEHRQIPDYTKTNLNFPSSAKYRLTKEVASLVDPDKVQYYGDLKIIKSVSVNGSAIHAGSLDYASDNSTTSTLIRLVDTNTKTIIFSRTFSPLDTIEIIYYSLVDDFIYYGYSDYQGNYFPLDLNPEYGHYIGDPTDLSIRPSSMALLERVILYVMPTAYCLLRRANDIISSAFEPAIDDSEKLGTLNLRFIRAEAFNERNFLRHLVTADVSSASPGTNLYGSSSLAAWGYAMSGRNYYDEYSVSNTDIASEVIPSMLPIGRFSLSVPPSIKSVANYDIRTRGGGLREDFELTGIEQSDVASIKGYFDVGTWAGAPYKEGGIIQITIDSSILRANETELNKYSEEEIYEIVKAHIPPGIQFEIIYSDI